MRDGRPVHGHDAVAGREPGGGALPRCSAAIIDGADHRVDPCVDADAASLRPGIQLGPDVGHELPACALQPDLQLPFRCGRDFAADVAETLHRPPVDGRDAVAGLQPGAERRRRPVCRDHDAVAGRADRETRPRDDGQHQQREHQVGDRPGGDDRDTPPRTGGEECPVLGEPRRPCVRPAAQHLVAAHLAVAAERKPGDLVPGAAALQADQPLAPAEGEDLHVHARCAGREEVAGFVDQDHHPQPDHADDDGEHRVHDVKLLPHRTRGHPAGWSRSSPSPRRAPECDGRSA